MVSLRFPFSFSQPTPPPAASRPFSSSAAALSLATAGATAAFAAVSVLQYPSGSKPKNPFLRHAFNFLLSPSHSLPIWGCLSLAENSHPVVEAKTGASFPSVLNETQKLSGIGLRKKSILGLKNIDVYAFGVYADENDIKKSLSKKYGKLSASEIKGNKEFHEDLMESDIRMTIRLQIVYGRLSIRSVRSAFEDSVGSRLQKFGGSDNKDLLQRFTSQFKDDYKIPRGSVICLSREQCHVLHTTIDGKDVGSIQSKLLCRSILDLYIGADPFDKQAKEDIEHNLASFLQK